MAADRGSLRDIVERTNVFRPDEVDVAVELMDVAIEDPAQTDYILFTAVDDNGTVTGYYCVGKTPMTVSTWDLYWIAVDPELHGQGIGSELLKHCERRVADDGGTLIMVETSSQPKYEPTRTFYLRHGYHEAARIGGYYARGDDLVIYTKSL